MLGESMCQQMGLHLLLGFIAAPSACASALSIPSCCTDYMQFLRAGCSSLTYLAATADLGHGTTERVWIQTHSVGLLRPSRGARLGL